MAAFVAVPLIVAGLGSTTAVASARRALTDAGRPAIGTRTATARAVAESPGFAELPRFAAANSAPVGNSPVAGSPRSAAAPAARLLGRVRIVAFYGGPDGPALGVLGSASPDAIATQVEQRARAFAGYGEPVQPAMELIATVAQGSPGPDGSYSAAIGDADIERYLSAAHRHHLLLILDFQPGRGEFLPQVRAVSRFLLDPSVSVALDPEWKMGAGDVPGVTIGSSSAASVQAVVDYVSRFTRAHVLPDKLVLVHQFTLGMLPDRGMISPEPGAEVVFHADGFGTPGEKLSTWSALAFPGRPFGTGFKLFLTQDTAMMSARQVMALRPRPDVITFQ